MTNENEPTPNYYAIIPADVRYHKQLSAQEKLLYGEITALANNKGYCWATNNYFAKLYDLSKRTVSGQISKLTEHGFIRVEIIYYDKSSQIKERRIYLRDTPTEEKFHTPTEENFHHNNININNTSINNTPKRPKKNKFEKKEPLNSANSQKSEKQDSGSLKDRPLEVRKTDPSNIDINNINFNNIDFKERAPAKKKKNKFVNFEQRKTDYDALAQLC